MANRTELTASGFVDDMFLEHATLEITRTGVARYSFIATTTDGAISLEIWTTVKARISVRIDDDIGVHSWFVLRTEREILESLTAKDCAVHLEQLDRGHYFLGLCRGPDEIRLHLDAPGYIKARPVDMGPPTQPSETA
jgi:hypothetical protein